MTRARLLGTVRASFVLMGGYYPSFVWIDLPPLRDTGKKLDWERPAGPVRAAAGFAFVSATISR